MGERKRSRLYMAPADVFRSYKEKYHLLETIGEGTYGVVFRGVESSTGRIVALKKIRTNTPDDGLPATSIREIKLLKNLQHSNIIKLHSVFHEPAHGRRQLPVLLLEFDHLECDLRKFTKRFPKRRMPLPIVKLILAQILSALHFCHERQVIHRDMKPSNVLVHFSSPRPSQPTPGTRVQASLSAKQILDRLDASVAPDGTLNSEIIDLLMSSLCVKLADFGLARIFPVPVRPLTHEVVTLWYRAPEVVLGFEHYTTAIDIWAVGCIMLELLYGRPIFAGDSEMETLYKIFQLLGTPTEEEWPQISKLPCWKAQWPRWPRRPDCLDYLRSDLDADGKDLLLQLLRFAPEDRCTAAEALSHPFFEGRIWPHNDRP